jgi:hypothetical protein
MISRHVRWGRLCAGCVAFSLTISLVAAEPPDYEQPKLLTGKVFESGTSNVLYHFKRTGKRDGETVYVLREFTYPDGKLAARERVTYIGGKLASFQLDELQIGAQGTTTAETDAKGRRKLLFTYSTGVGNKAKKKTSSEVPSGEAVVGDMLPVFLRDHWDELMRGKPASFRFIAQDRLETVGFKIVKEAETTWRGQPAVRLRMEPTSMIISAIVDPLFFIVEKNGTHRVLEYDGRTTPKKGQGASWKDLDAVTIYDWTAEN